MTSTNSDRAVRATHALAYYVQKQLHEAYNLASREENIIDLLTDLQHLASAENLDFKLCLRLADTNFEAERGEGTDE